MYSLWWSNHIVPTYVSRVAKSTGVVCENFVRKHKWFILWRVMIWEGQLHSTHNHNYLMGTTTFELHNITPTSPKNTLATILKAFWFFLLFMFFAYFSFKYIMHGHIGERKENTQLCKLNILILLCKCYTLLSTAFINCTQIYDWWILVVRWLFISFS